MVWTAEKKAPDTAALIGRLIEYRKQEKRTRGMHDAGFLVENPAMAKMTGLQARRWGKLAMDEGLGTEQPAKAVVAPDPENKMLLILPGMQDHPNAIDVRYYRGSAFINLGPVFSFLGRTVEPGTEEFYRCEPSTRPIQIGDLTGMGFVMPLEVQFTRHVKQQKQSRAAAKKASDAKESAAPAQESK